GYQLNPAVLVAAIAAISRLLIRTLSAPLKRHQKRAQTDSRYFYHSYLSFAGYSSNGQAGKGSRAASHSLGIAAAPVNTATIPPTIAQVVSRSPSPLTVSQSASTKLLRYEPAHQSENGTVSCAETPVPLPNTATANCMDAF